MWYGIVKYSFDADKPIYGPFETEDDAWNFIETQVDEEYRIDTEENGWDSKITKNKTCNEITIENIFTSETDVTEFFIFEINNTKLI